MSRSPRPRREGVALLTVLLLVAVMSALAVAVLDDIRFGLRRAQNAESVGQAQWYALGAETLARARIRALVERDPGRLTADGGWQDRPFVFPIEGGVIEARLRDASACFNLNSLVTGRDPLLIRNELAVRQLTALLTAVGVAAGEAAQLASGLADWIDSNADTAPQGGEDEVYARLLRPYRTGNALLAEVSEIRAVRGFTPEVYARVRPHVCALPQPNPSTVNVNTLRPENAVVLSALVEGRLGPAAAEGVLRARPAGGWSDAAAFWAQPALAQASPDNTALTQAGFDSRFFALEVRVDYAGAQVVMSSLLERDASGAIRTVARRWTPDE